MTTIETIQIIENEPWFTKWLSNCLHVKSTASGVGSLIGGIFAWSTSPEGHTFWSGIAQEYHHYELMVSSDLFYAVLEKHYTDKYPELFI